MDLDRFKYVNDTLGHQIGDLLLREVAERLTNVVRRESDTVARLGGDEFVVLLPSDDADGARRVARNIQKALETPMSLDGHVVDCRASIGIASFPEHGDNATTLLRRADVAMYTAKRLNNGLAVYDDQDDEHSRARLSLMGELRNAVERTSWCCTTSRRSHLADPRELHVEALVRWQHPTRGLVAAVRVHPVRRADRLHPPDHALGDDARGRAVRAVAPRGAAHARVDQHLGARPARPRACRPLRRPARRATAARRRGSRSRSPRARSSTTRATRCATSSGCTRSAAASRSTTTAPAIRRSRT